jgi:hypothetical protein
VPHQSQKNVLQHILGVDGIPRYAIGSPEDLRVLIAKERLQFAWRLR